MKKKEKVIDVGPNPGTGKKIARGFVGFFVGFFVLVAVFSSFYTVGETESVVITTFGKATLVDEKGLHFKIPFVQTVDKLPKQTLLYDLSPSDVITSDKKTMICDSYVLWRISDPIKFAQALNCSITNAESRLNTTVYNSTKNVIFPSCI